MKICPAKGKIGGTTSCDGSHTRGGAALLEGTFKTYLTGGKIDLLRASKKQGRPETATAGDFKSF